MIDLHAHVLPGIDDGPPTMDDAVTLARAFVDAGTTAVAATSHVDHKFGLGPGELAAARETLQARLDGEGIPLRVLQGGECTASRLTEMDADAIRGLTLGDGRHVLLECPFTPAGTMFDNVVFRAQSLGFEVLLGHPERSPDFLGDVDRLAELVGRRVQVQVTASSLAGTFGRTVQRGAIEMLAAGLVHVIASDAHDARHRPPRLREPLEAGARLADGLLEHAEYWTEIAPQAILDGAPVPEPPAVEPRRLRIAAQKLRRRR